MKHREAYCLMNYRCETCGAVEVLWNSRDGVTPFSIPCISCGADSLTGMTHVRFDLDRRAPLYSPRPGHRYFADMSPERARAAANRNADRLVSMGRVPRKDRNRVSDDLFRDYYRDGTAPDILQAPPINRGAAEAIWIDEDRSETHSIEVACDEAFEGWPAKYAAFRRAVVLAAAEIGKAMPHMPDSNHRPLRRQQVKERPILFSAPMVRAILAGQKTQTRRIFKYKNGGVQPRENDIPGMQQLLRNCPYGQPGDRLWVRESWQYYDWNEEGEPCVRFAADNATTWPEPGMDVWADKLVDVWEVLSRDENFRIDNRARDRRWRPSIHMPRWASRILLEVVSRRLERLQDISEADCIAEGAPGGHGVIPGYAYAATPLEHYRHIWTEINGQASWDANPWVWVVEFKHRPAGD